MNRIFLWIINITILSFLIISSNVKAETLVIQSGKLAGISGVNVLGYGLYDVEFSNTWQGVLYTESFAVAATDAIYSLFSSGGSFELNYYDRYPANTLGCESYVSCQWLTSYDNLITPSSNTVLGPAFVNLNTTGVDYNNPLLYVYPQTDYSTINHANWTPVSSVPIPNAIILFSTAMLGLRRLCCKAAPLRG